jgi:hypothetical protein
LAAPSLQQQLSESVYEVGLPAEVDVEALRRAVVDLLAADALMRQRHRPKDNRSQSFDLRPLILDLVLDERADGALWLRLRLVQSATQMGRPDDVLAALGLEPLDARVHRLGLRFAD